jgi:hypothetical protein
MEEERGTHRHVRGVGDERRTLHDRVNLAVFLHGQFGEVHKHLSHLVATLAAADVDDRI